MAVVHPRINSMEKDGETVHLEPKVMQVLVGYRLITSAVLAEPDQPEGTTPHEPAPNPALSSNEASLLTETSTAQVLSPLHTTSDTPKPRIKLKLLSIGLTAFGIGAVSWAFLAFRSNPRRANHGDSYSSRPLTTYPGYQLQPSFSPDGSAVVFVWIKDGERSGHIYVKLLGSEAPARLTSGSAEELSPVWSPDGRWIAFIRHDDTQSTVNIIPAIGGSEQEIYRLPTNHVWEYGGLTWLSNGKALIFPQQATPQSASGLVQVSIEGHTAEPLTSPPKGWNGDWTPAVSPDGTKLAFIRGSEGSVYDIYVMNLPHGEPTRITHDNRLIVGLSWSSDGSSIVFSSNRSGSISLWRVSASGGDPQHEPAGGDNAYSPSISLQGSRLVYSHGSASWSILAADLGGKPSAADAEILTSSERDASPHVSPPATRSHSSHGALARRRFGRPELTAVIPFS